MSDSGAKRKDGAAKSPRRPDADLLPERLSGLRLGIAGPGRVGRSFARWARAAGADLRLVVCRTPPEDEVFHDVPVASFSTVFTTVFDPQAARDAPTTTLDVLLLTVSDDALAMVADRWASQGAAPRGADPPFRAVLHSSGCFDAEILAPLRSVGIAVGSLHPLRAFPDVVPEAGPNPFFAIDGEPEALALARRMAESWCGTCCELSGERRVVYHLAASLAAGGVVTALAMVTELMRRAGLPDRVLGGYLELLRGAVDAAQRTAADAGPAALASAITGPAARGDEATLERHRQALLQLAPELAPTVESLWRETSRQTELQERAATGERSGPRPSANDPEDPS